MLKLYKNLYIDGFVATMQCECLKYCLKPLETEGSNDGNDDTVVGSALLICQDNYVRNNESFDIKDGSNYNYRNI
jgi:hypothetical protein